MMRPIEIELRVGVDGAITPLRLRMAAGEGRFGPWLTVAQISRRWADEAGEHWLVMIAGAAQIVELARTPGGAWQAIRRSGGAALA